MKSKIEFSKLKIRIGFRPRVVFVVGTDVMDVLKLDEVESLLHP